MISYKKIESALNFPQEWDSLAISYFQKKEFLLHCEKYNPCKQRYYCLNIDDKFAAGAIVYTLSLDILTFIGLPSPIKVKITGVPCSVSAQGIIGEKQYFTELIKYIQSQEKGFQLTLNIEGNIDIKNIINGRTLPTIWIKNNFKDWNNYKECFRSDYRRRFNKIRKSFLEIEQKRGRCSDFNADMYALYRQVLKKSKGKLETLNKEFFLNLPSAFSLTSYYKNEKIIGWYISTTCIPEYYFFLGGIDYSENKKHNTYFNILAEIVKEGIQKKAGFIDLGQTAEIPKMRLGGKVIEKRMIGFHSSKILNKLLQKVNSILEYKTQFPAANTLK